MFLPITHRGSFFQDSFFSNFHQHFDTAVRDVLNRWNDSELKVAEDMGQRQTDLLNRYRRLRSVDLKEDNQAVAITSDDNSRKVVLDVHDFMGGDVKVKVVGEKDLVVEGRVDKKNEGSSAMSSHTFRRRFSLPRLTDVNAISSVMSSDGILTVTTPKIESDSQHKATIIPIQMEGNAQGAIKNGHATNADPTQYKCEQCCHDESSKMKTTQPQGGISFPITNYRNQENQASQGTVQGSSAPHVIPIEREVSLQERPVDPSPVVSPGYVAQEPVFSQQTLGSQNANMAEPLHQVSTHPTQNASIDPHASSTAPHPSSTSSTGAHAPGGTEDLSTGPKSLGARGKVVLPAQQEEENVDYMSALKPRKDGKFPIKISGTVINSNAV